MKRKAGSKPSACGPSAAVEDPARPLKRLKKLADSQTLTPMKIPTSFKEHASSPLSDQILEFCESDLFKETIQNSDVTSVSNYCYEEQSSYAKNLSFPPDMINYAMPATTTSDCGDGYFTAMFEEKALENDISTPLDFTNLQQYSFSHQDDQFDISLLENQISRIPPYPLPNDQTDVVSMMGSMGCENDYLSMPPSKCMRLNNPSSPSNCFLDHPYLASRNSNPILPMESCGIFNGNMSLSNEIQAHELDFRGDNDGIFCLDPLPRPYNSNDQLQYACRKTLADSRPRVRGRFAKNEEFFDHHRNTCNTHEEDTDEDVKSMHVVVKEEDHENEKLDSLDIFTHISSLNSFRYNYPIQSWI
ncbi:uncharacterized protein LOC143553311 [Bidens hawaiensis]|uniref:uncharacterized protein LOC143553311 n=1 Tax=Bidens hawaiensis TaxID=980011 RepID=UPI00404A81A5